MIVWDTKQPLILAFEMKLILEKKIQHNNGSIKKKNGSCLLWKLT